MIRVFSGQNADEAWRSAVDCFKNGHNIGLHRSRDGDAYEFLHAGFTIENPRQRWVVSRRPPMNPAFAIAEIIWILNGLNDSKYINYWNRQMPKFCGKVRHYHGAYGHRLRRHLDIDQLERAYQALKSNPDTRQVVLQIWDSRIDFPYSTGRFVSKDIPCNLVSLLQVRDKKLHWMQVIRSNDMFLGVPHNFVQFTYLQELLAGWLNIEVGPYNQISNSLHVYIRDKGEVYSYAKTETMENNDLIRVTKNQSEKLCFELLRRMESLAGRHLTKGELIELSKWLIAPVPFRNLLLVLAAQSARNRRWNELSHEVMENCTNPALRQLWMQWVTRHNK